MRREKLPGKSRRYVRTYSNGRRGVLCDAVRPGPEGRQGMPPLRTLKVSRAPGPTQKDIYSYIYI
jgi:hypothetical protein